MSDTIGRRVRRVGQALVALLVAIAVSVPLTGGLLAQESPGASWEQLQGVPGPAQHLFAPTSGALLAQVDAALYRSDDGGATWRPVALPPLADKVTTRQIAVDPGNHQRVYATGAEGLYRTVGDTASWQVIWPNDPDFPVVAAFAASPADPELVYLVVRAQHGRVIRMMRTDDGGQTWAMLEQDGHQHLACTWGVFLLQPHPTDPDRVFRSIECQHGLASSQLQESRDRGQTWDVLADLGGARPETVQDPRGRPAPAPAPAPVGQVVTIDAKLRALGTAGLLTIGQGVEPGRYYLVVTRPHQGGGMSLLRSDDDGRTWVEQAAYSGGGGMTAANDPRPNVTVSGLAVDPCAPDHLYAAFHEQVKGQPAAHVIRTSADGGKSWRDLPGPSLGGNVALALGIDGRNLYAATESGIWRLALAR